MYLFPWIHWNISFIYIYIFEFLIKRQETQATGFSVILVTLHYRHFVFILCVGCSCGSYGVFSWCLWRTIIATKFFWGELCTALPVPLPTDEVNFKTLIWLHPFFSAYNHTKFAIERWRKISRSIGRLLLAGYTYIWFKTIFKSYVLSSWNKSGR